MNIEVLVAAMHQSDLSLYEKMNIKTNAIIANQCDSNFFIQSEIEHSVVKMYSTSSRGVGINRNLALVMSTGDILIFSDEDVIFKDDYVQTINDAFTEFPNADMICFGTEFTLNGKLYNTRMPKKGKLPFRKSLKFGAVAMAVKKKSLDKKNIFFTQLFGGGCLYSHGEDSDFIVQCYKCGLKIYSYNKVICETAKDSSTCFEGYNEKYFYDTGALASFIFSGLLKHLYLLYIPIRIKDTKLDFFTRRKLIKAGAKNFKFLKSYYEYKSEVDK